MADGLTALSKYTGATLALQQSADVQFPNLTGGTSDLFAPGDQLLDLMSTSAVAQVRLRRGAGQPAVRRGRTGRHRLLQRGLTGRAGPLSAPWSQVSWSTRSGEIKSGGQRRRDGRRPARRPQALSRIDGSDGDPDVSVKLVVTPPGGTATRTFTARSMPHTVQDVVARIRQLDGRTDAASAATATVDLAANRLDVDVDLRRPSAQKSFALGNPATLGALVGLTGLENGGAGSLAPVTATDASYDVGFGVSFADPAADQARATVLLPKDASLITVRDIKAAKPSGATGIDARIGFLGVKADVDDVALSTAGDRSAAALALTDGVPDALALSDLIDADGRLRVGKVALSSGLQGAISVRATEQKVGGSYVVSKTGAPASGSATVSWDTTGLPRVGFAGAYSSLRVFDPVPGQFLHGTVGVTSDGTTDKVTVTVPDAVDLLSLFNVGEGKTSAELSRRLIGPGVACQNFTVTARTLTCTGLAPQGVSALGAGSGVDLIAAGDPFALRDGVIEGLAQQVSAFDALDRDNVTDALSDDQYLSTLPLVDLTPAQAATERTGLATLVSGLSAAADKDSAGKGGVGGGGSGSVSSAQEMVAAVAASTKVREPALALNVSDGSVVASLSGRTRSGETAAHAPALPGGRPRPGPRGREEARRRRGRLDHRAVDRRRPCHGPAAARRRHPHRHDGDHRAPRRQGRRRLPGRGRLVLRRARRRVGPPRGEGQLGLRPRGRHPQDHPCQRARHQRRRRYGHAGRCRRFRRIDHRLHREGHRLLRWLRHGRGPAGDGRRIPGRGPGRLRRGPDLRARRLDGPQRPGQQRDAGRGPAAGQQPGRRRRRRREADRPHQRPARLARRDRRVHEVQGPEGQAGERSHHRAGGVGTERHRHQRHRHLHRHRRRRDRLRLHRVGRRRAEHDREVGQQARHGPLRHRASRRQHQVRPQGRDRRLLAAARHAAPDARRRPGGHGRPGQAARRGRGRGDEAVRPAECRGRQGLSLDRRSLHEGRDGLPAGRSAPAGGDAENSQVDFGVTVGLPATAQPTTYSLFDLYDGTLATTASFDPTGHTEEKGLELSFATTGNSNGAFDLDGTVKIPWTPTGFGAGGTDATNITYSGVTLDGKQIVAGLKTPFQAVDPYLGPARDVMNVLRAKLPVVSDLSELAGGGEISMLSLLQKFGPKNKKLDLALRVVNFIDWSPRSSG